MRMCELALGRKPVPGVGAMVGLSGVVEWAAIAAVKDCLLVKTRVPLSL